MDCLDTLIGLSQTTCECYKTPPTGYNDSDSGIYIDEAKGFNLDLLTNSNNCKTGGMWEILDTARTQAKQELIRDLNRCLTTDAKNKYASCKGLLISTKKDGVALTTLFIAVEITPECNGGTCLNITNLGLLATSVGNIDWFVYSNQDLTTAIDSGSFVTTSTGISNTKVDINLDLSCEGCIDLKYYIVYELNGVTTSNNKIWCTPCSGGKKACNTPFYTQQGIGGTLVADIDTWTTTPNHANGITYSGEVVCNVEVCDYLISDKNVLYSWIATAYQFKAAECAYLRVIKSGDFSQYTTLGLDPLNETLIDYKEWYDEAMAYVCQEISKQGHPCLVCDAPMQRRTIYA